MRSSKRCPGKAKTPPLSLTLDDGERNILLYDESVTLPAWARSNKLQGYLILGPGLKVRLRTCRRARRRYQLIQISIDNETPYARELREWQEFQGPMPTDSH